MIKNDSRTGHYAALAILPLTLADATWRLVDNEFSVWGGAIIALVLRWTAAFLLVRGIHPAVSISLRTGESAGLAIIKIFIVLNIASLLRGILDISDYWDLRYIALDFCFTVVAPLAAFSVNSWVASRALSSFIKLIPFYFIALPFSLDNNTELFPRVVAPVSLLVLFASYRSRQAVVATVGVALISLLLDISYRTNDVRIVFSLAVAVGGALGLFYGALGPIRKGVFAFALASIFLAPLVFLSLGVSGRYNVFDPPSTTATEASITLFGKEPKAPLDADSRTFLYEEVFASMIRRDESFIFGGGAGSGYDSIAFSDTFLNNRGRIATEVGFLNVLMSSGLLAVLLYFAVLLVASVRGVFQSRNSLARMIGFFVAIRWVIFFFEDIPAFDLNQLSIWFSIGLCMSRKFCEMSECELRETFGYNISK